MKRNIDCIPKNFALNNNPSLSFLLANFDLKLKNCIARKVQEFKIE